MFVYQLLTKKSAKESPELLAATQTKIMASRIDDRDLKLQSGILHSSFLSIKTDFSSLIQIGPVPVPGFQPYSGTLDIYYDLKTTDWGTAIYIKPTGYDHYVPISDLQTTVLDSNNKPVTLRVSSMYYGGNSNYPPLGYSIDGITDRKWQDNPNYHWTNYSWAMGDFLHIAASSDIFSVKGSSTVAFLEFSAFDVVGDVDYPNGEKVPIPPRCFYRPTGYQAFLWSDKEDIDFTSTPASGVKDTGTRQSAPLEIQNYPNPFTASQGTRVSFTLPKDAHIRVKVYNIMGGEVATLADELHMAGKVEVGFQPNGNLPAGVYICRLEVDGQMANTKPILLVK